MMPGSPGLRILFLVDELRSITNGGSERQVLQLIEMLQDSDNSVELAILRGSEWVEKEWGGCFTHRFEVGSLSSPNGFRRLWRLMRLMRTGRFDVLQTMFWESNLIGPVLGRIAGVPVILGSRRNLNYWMSPRVARLQSISNRLATRLVANSEAVKQVVAEKERTPRSKIDVLYNGIEVQKFARNAQSGQETRAQFNIPGDVVLVGNVSTFRSVKGLDIFVRAAALVLESHSAAYFMIVGDGPTMGETRDLVTQLGIGQHCIFAKAQINVEPFLSAFDIGVLSSRSEGFSNSLLEYMAAGLPVVATDVGGNRETLGDTGMLVRAEDPIALATAISELMRSSERRKAMGEKARQRVEELFNIKDVQQRYREYVARLASEHGLRSTATIGRAATSAKS